MTVCAVITPTEAMDGSDGPAYPIIIADTMVSLEGEAIGPEAPVHLPSRLEPSDPDAVPAKFAVRKINTFGPVAVALAGRGWAIRELVRMVQDSVNQGLDETDPFGFLRASTERARSLYGPDCCWFVGLLRRDQTYSVASDGPQFRTDLLGQCAVVGSGAKPVIEFCQRFDDFGPRQRNPLARAASLVALLNAERIGREIIDESLDSWGGYFELARRDGGVGPWIFGPDAVHVFLIAQEHENNEFSLAIDFRFICYTSRGDKGQIIVMVGQEGSHKAEISGDMLSQRGDLTYRIELKALGEEDESDPAVLDEIWLNFEPAFVTMTVINLIREDTGYLMSDVFINPSTDDFEFKIWPVPAGFRKQLTMSTRFINKFGEELNLPGRKYRRFG